VPNPSQTLLITNAERKQKNERECKGGKARCEPRRFLTGVAEPIDPLALFFYLYIYLFLFFCFFFTHSGSANRGKPREEKNIASALAFGATRRGWSGLLSGPVTVVLERDAGGDRRTRSRIGVGAGRDSREAATVFFVFFDQRTVAAGETERRRLVFPGLEKKNTGSVAIKTGSAHQFNPNTYRMKVQG
jgi:hypothetical protein